MADNSTLSWVFQLLDKISSPAGKMSASLKHVQKGLGEYGNSAQRAHKHSDSLGLKLLELKEIGEGVYHIFHKLGEKVFDFSKEVINATAFRQQSMLALDAVTGSHEKAKKVMELAEVLANGMGIPAQMMISWAKDLALAKTSFNNIDTLLKAAGDIAVLIGGQAGLGKAEAFVDIMSRMGGAVDVPVRKLLELQQVLPNQSDILGELAKMYHLAGTRAAEFKKDLTEQRIPVVNANDVQKAAVRALESLEHGPLGSLAKKNRGGVAGTMQALSNAWEAGMADFGNGPGMRNFLGVINNLIKLMGPGGEVHKMIRELVNGPMADFFKQFTGPEGLKKMKSDLEGVLKVVLLLTKAIMGLFKVVSYPLRLGLDMGAAVKAAELDKARNTLMEEAFKPGSQSKSAIDMARKLLNMDAGAQMYGPPSSAFTPGVGKTPQEYRKPAGGKQLGMAPTINIEINAPGAGPDTIQQMQAMIAREVPTAVASALEQAAIQAGVA